MEDYSYSNAITQPQSSVAMLTGAVLLLLMTFQNRRKTCKKQTSALITPNKFIQPNVIAGTIAAIVALVISSAYALFFSHLCNNKFCKAGRSIISIHFVLVNLTINGIFDFIYNAKRYRSLYQPVHDYLEETEIGNEVLTTLNHRFMLNMMIVRTIQKKLLPTRQEEARLLLDDTTASVTSTGSGAAAAPPVVGEAATPLPPLQEAYRYLRHSTAVYGFEMVAAAEIESNRDPNFLTSTRNSGIISSHVHGIDRDTDILHEDMEWGESSEYLRHMLVVDRQHEAIVLSLRGTCSLSTAIMDVTAYSKRFCGGYAHSGMAVMAKNTWKRVEKHVTEALLEYPEDYKFVITGHSLGGGVACLIQLMLHTTKYFPKRLKQCFAFAPTPSFYFEEGSTSNLMSKRMSQAISNTYAYVHDNDVVASVSTDSVRKAFRAVYEVDQLYTRHLTWKEQWDLLVSGGGGNEKNNSLVSNNHEIPEHMNIPDHVIQRVQHVRDNHVTSILPTKDGAHTLRIPSSCIVWLHQHQQQEEEPSSIDDNDNDYDTKEGDDSNSNIDNNNYSVTLLDPIKYSKRLLDLDPCMIENHFLPKYELAFGSVLGAQAK